MKTDETRKTCQQAITPELIQKIEELAGSISYGSINLVFQDGILIQIEKSEKFRISQEK